MEPDFFLCFPPLLSCSSPLYGVAPPGDPSDFAAASEPAKMVGFAHLQFSLARKLLVLPQMSSCLQLCLPSWGKERIQKAQEGMVSFRIIVPPKPPSMCIERSRGPETDGSVTVRMVALVC